METIDEKQMVRFLLGDLSEESRLKLEDRFFKEDRFYQELLAIQEELADDYVQDKLSASERAQFEKHFLRSARRRERVEFAAAFSEALSRPESLAPVLQFKTPWWQSLLAFVRPQRAGMVWGGAVVAFVLVIGTVWLAVENRRLSGSLEQARQEQGAANDRIRTSEAEAAQRERELKEELAALREQGGELETMIQQKQRELEALRRSKRATEAQPTSSQIAAFILAPGLTRGTDEPEKVIIPSGVESVQLQLDLEREEDYPSYLAEVRTARGNLAWSKGGLTVHQTSYGHAVTVKIPARLLSTGEYEVGLKGVRKGKLEAIGYYYFISLSR
jgi:hypothetical protein